MDLEQAIFEIQKVVIRVETALIGTNGNGVIKKQEATEKKLKKVEDNLTTIIANCKSRQFRYADLDKLSRRITYGMGFTFLILVMHLAGMEPKEIWDWFSGWIKP